eukprot:CAMPEP_0195058126 /NCGR_PEP_ID=MMETSP0448-20130528/6103_1 /TAXON_ID=66468 /ORGANISM="Heterocapsa triquestra, Strain CCMP 448" /LENGTH=37 /DNA_ID= /DNA_START= /DNA_END= /DNA_ORIENTATION=
MSTVVMGGMSALNLGVPPSWDTPHMHQAAVTLSAGIR